MDLEKLLVEVVLGGVGLGLIVSAIWKWIEKAWAWAANLELTPKRVVIAVLGFVVTQPVYFLAVWLGFVPRPATLQEWFIATVGVCIATFSGSTFFHGLLDSGEDPRQRHLT